MVVILCIVRYGCGGASYPGLVRKGSSKYVWHAALDRTPVVNNVNCKVEASEKTQLIALFKARQYNDFTLAAILQNILQYCRNKYPGIVRALVRLVTLANQILLIPQCTFHIFIVLITVAILQPKHRLIAFKFEERTISQRPLPI